MTTMRVDALIGLRDNLTPGLRAMSGVVRALAHDFNMFGKIAARDGISAGRNLTTMAGNLTRAMAPMAGMGYALLRGREDIDKALRQFQVVATDTVGTQRERLRDLVNDMGPRIGVAQLDIVRGASEAIQAGLEAPDLFAAVEGKASLIERLAMAAKVANSSIPNLSRDLVTLAKSFNLPWGNPKERAETIEQLMGIALVAPRLSPDTPEGHVRSLLQFGPIFRSMGGTVEEASALQTILSRAGFRDSRGGYAMNTLLARIQNPTVRAQMQMSMARGPNGERFNMERIFGGDVSRISPQAMVDALRIGGIDARGALPGIAEMIGQGTGGDVLAWKTRLAERIAKDLKLGKGAVRERGLIRTGIDSLVATSNAGINTIALLEELSKLPSSAHKDLAGIMRIPQSQVLAIVGQAGQMAKILAEIRRQGPGALDEGFGIRNEGWAASLDRLRGSWESARSALWTRSGAEASAGTMLDQVAGALDRISKLSPSELKAVLGALSVAAAPAGLVALGLSLGAIAKALEVIATRGPTAMAAIGLTVAAGAENRRATSLVEYMQGRAGMDTFWRDDEALAFGGQRLPRDEAFENQMKPWGWRLGEWLGNLFSSNPSPRGNWSASAGGFTGPPAQVNVNITGQPPGTSIELRSSPGVELNRGVSMPDTRRPSGVGHN